MNDDSIVKIMQSLDLNYGPAILSTQHFEKAIQSLNQQLQGMKAIAMQSAKDINATFAQQLGSVPGAGTILDQFGKPLSTIQAEAKKAGAGISNSFKPATDELKKHGQSVQDIGNQYNILGNEMQRRASWFMTGAMFYGTINAGKEAVQTIAEVEMGMVEIARVMDDSTFVFKDYRDELLQLGVDYGQTFDTVQQIALRWAQSGYNVADSLELTKTSLLALNTAELDAKNATESMIGIMAQWQLEAEDLALVMDKINITADNYSVTSQDLVDGLLRSSGAARNMNMSLDETISLLTVMREASGRTGREVGNALNSILSYTTRQTSINTLEALGIPMFTDESRSQFRNAMDIYRDIAKNWDSFSKDIQDGFVKSADDAGLFNEELANAIGLQEEWNDVQKRDVSQSAAGVHRRNYFIGMIERMAETQGVLNNMMDAAGYSLRENDKTMEALSKKYVSLKASAEMFSVAIGDAGLIGVLKGLVDTGTGALQLFTKLPGPLRDLAANFIVVTAAIQTFKAAGKMLGFEGMVTSIKNAVKAQDLLNKAIKAGSIDTSEALKIQKAWKAGIEATELSEKAATVQTELFGIAMKGTTVSAAALQAALGIGIPLVISGFVTAFARANQAKEEAKQRADELIQKLQQERRELNDLKDEYAKIVDVGDLTEESKQRLKTIQDKLIETYGLEADALDLVNGKYEDQIKLIDEAAVRKAKAELAALGADPDRARAALSEIGVGNVRASGYNKELDAAVKMIEGASLVGPTSTLAKALMSDDRFYVKVVGTVEERRELLNKLILTLRDIPNKSDGIARTIDALSDEFTKLDEFITKNKDVLEKEKKALEIIDSFVNPPLGDVDSGDAPSSPLERLQKGSKVDMNSVYSTLSGYRAYLRSMLNANKITLKEYYEKLSEIRTELFGQYIGKSNKELEYLHGMSEHTSGVTAFLDLENELVNTLEKIKKEAEGIKEPVNEALQAELKLLDHKKRIGELSTQQEIDQLKRLQAEYSMNTEERRNIIERIYSAEQSLLKDKEKLEKEATKEAEQRAKDLANMQKELTKEWTSYYKDELKDMQSEIKKAYNEQIGLIEEKARLDKKAHEDRIKQIDDELKALDRSEQKYDYEQKMQELHEQEAYWSVRTGENARKSLADTRKQIAEAEHDREIELQKNALQDEKETLQDKIDAIEDATKDEVEKWEKAYADIEDAFDSHALDIISSAGAMAEGAFDQWVEKYYNPLMELLDDGTVNGLSGKAAGMQVSIAVAGIQQLADTIIDLKRQYEIDGNTFAHQQAKLYYRQLSDLSPSVAEQLQRMNYKQAQKYYEENLSHLHSGGETLSYGAAYVKPGELVFPPDLSTIMLDLISFLKTSPIQSRGVTTDNNRQINLNGPLLNIEKSYFEDGTDERSFAKEIQREILKIK
jgi:DNA repair exonuclease SbcCD ATPase subunit